jgi:hypothetical protein
MGQLLLLGGLSVGAAAMLVHFKTVADVLGDIPETALLPSASPKASSIWTIVKSMPAGKLQTLIPGG